MNKPERRVLIRWNSLSKSNLEHQKIRNFQKQPKRQIEGQIYRCSQISIFESRSYLNKNFDKIFPNRNFIVKKLKSERMISNVLSNIVGSQYIVVVLFCKSSRNIVRGQSNFSKVSKILSSSNSLTSFNFTTSDVWQGLRTIAKFDWRISRVEDPWE